ncbi:hypothetical protein [Mycobacterium haemophilum]
MGQINRAFGNIVNMLHEVRDQLGAASRYEHQEQTSQQILQGS